MRKAGGRGGHAATYRLGLEDGRLSGLGETREDRSAVTAEMEHPELRRSPEKELGVRRLPPAAASAAALLPQALRALRDAPAETAALKTSVAAALRLPVCFSLFSSRIVSLMVCLSFLAVLLSLSSSVSSLCWPSERFGGGSQSSVETQAM